MEAHELLKQVRGARRAAPAAPLATPALTALRRPSSSLLVRASAGCQPAHSPACLPNPVRPDSPPPQICMEFGTTRRVAQSAAAAVQFGVDPEEALSKVDKLTRRLAKMEEVSGRGRGKRRM
jgi:hypothetical protein